MRYNNIGYAVDHTSKLSIDVARALERYIGARNIQDNTNEFDLVITLGGDGLMLKVLHKVMKNPIPIYGINCGSFGFLLNTRRNISSKDDAKQFIQKLESAVTVNLHPLKMHATSTSGEIRTSLAINEVAILRRSHQAANISIKINNELRLQKLEADGVLFATPAGSSAYNFAVGGPILPLNANVLALTPISPFRPRNWRGALLTSDSIVEFNNLSPNKRPIAVAADSFEISDALTVSVSKCRDIKLNILFDKHEGFEDRVLQEQFM
ncbi:MAG: NAD kinase [Proteobacteria bacterium]|nr:NAD kinase [Pseudomonadota bacterium]